MDIYNYMYIHIKKYIPASSNVICKIIAFSGIIAGGIFSASEQTLHFCHFACVCRF
jgi:hypothetical protein